MPSDPRRAGLHHLQDLHLVRHATRLPRLSPRSDESVSSLYSLSYFAIALVRLNCSSMRRRAAMPSRALAYGPTVSSSCQASARAAGSLGGTTRPVSPTIEAESQTSVTTQGIPQAMASPTISGHASP